MGFFPHWRDRPLDDEQARAYREHLGSNPFDLIAGQINIDPLVAAFSQQMIDTATICVEFACNASERVKFLLIMEPGATGPLEISPEQADIMFLEEVVGQLEGVIAARRARYFDDRSDSG